MHSMVSKRSEGAGSGLITGGVVEKRSRDGYRKKKGVDVYALIDRYVKR